MLLAKYITDLNESVGESNLPLSVHLMTTPKPYSGPGQTPTVILHDLLTFLVGG